jgi:membrane-bound metal-dependent hydrolase YbcI (DUF457 family)
MPLTPFHFGPSLLFGYLLRRRMDFLTFVVAGVILDVRAALVFVGVLSGPKHGFLHNTYLGALVVALVFAGIVLLIFRQFPSIAQQISSRPESPKAVVLASVAGTWLHVTLDAFTHSGMQPFYPLSGNPLYGLIGGVILYGLCVLAFIVFFGIVVISLVRNRRKHGSVYGESDGGPSKNLMSGIVIGIVVAMVVVVGASMTIDAIQGVGTPDVTVERINSTHAAVTWTTEKPTYGILTISVARQCGPAWGRRERINKINDSSLSRTHLIVESIYDLNESQVNLASVPGNGPLRWYQVSAISVGNRERPYTTIVQRNLSQACQ